MVAFAATAVAMIANPHDKKKAVATAVTTGATAGVIAAGTATVSVTAASAGTAGVGAVAIAVGPVGWCVLGAEAEPGQLHYNYDCWKAVLHDQTAEPSQGMLLRDVVADPRMKKALILDKEGTAVDRPDLMLQNIWNEMFRVEYVTLPTGQLALHAARV